MDEMDAWVLKPIDEVQQQELGVFDSKELAPHPKMEMRDCSCRTVLGCSKITFDPSARGLKRKRDVAGFDWRGNLFQNDGVSQSSYLKSQTPKCHHRYVYINIYIYILLHCSQTLNSPTGPSWLMTWSSSSLHYPQKGLHVLFLYIMKNCQILASALCAYVLVESNSVDLKIFEEYGINRLRWNRQRKTYVNRSKVSWLFDTPFRTYPLLEIIFEFNKPFSRYNSEIPSSVLCLQCFIHNLLWNVLIFGQTSVKDFSKSNETSMTN